VRTFSTSSWVTDSAAGATAYSCGVKTYNNAIGVDSTGIPCGTLLEAAQALGMMTGIVVTDAVAGATPGSFTAHATNRSMFEFIAKQQVDNLVDIIFGGGHKYYTKRKDGINLVDYAKAKGYTVLTSYSEFKTAELKLPLIVLFAEDQMEHEIDRNPEVQPSLSEMTQKALDLLSSHAKHGFFLMVEGSLIDVCGHRNDPAANYRDALAYDDAVGTVLEFSKSRPNTLVVSVSDHETGGLTLGVNGVYAWRPDILQAVRASSIHMAQRIRAGQSISSVLSELASINATAAEIQDIAQANLTSSLNNVGIIIGHVISSRAGVGWSTTGHTGVDINLYAKGYNSFLLKGNYDNTEVGNWVAHQFNLNLEDQTKKLATFNPNPVD